MGVSEGAAQARRVRSDEARRANVETRPNILEEGRRTGSLVEDDEVWFIYQRGDRSRAGSVYHATTTEPKWQGGGKLIL